MTDWRDQADGDGPTYTPYQPREAWHGEAVGPWPEQDAGPEYRLYRERAAIEQAIEDVTRA